MRVNILKYSFQLSNPLLCGLYSLSGVDGSGVGVVAHEAVTLVRLHTEVRAVRGSRLSAAASLSLITVGLAIDSDVPVASGQLGELEPLLLHGNWGCLLNLFGTINEADLEQLLGNGLLVDRGNVSLVDLDLLLRNAFPHEFVISQGILGQLDDVLSIVLGQLAGESSLEHFGANGNRGSRGGDGNGGKEFHFIIFNEFKGFWGFGAS